MGQTMLYNEVLTVSNDDLYKLSDRTAEENDDSVDLMVWVVDGSGPYTGLAFLGAACDSGSTEYTSSSKTSVTRGPSRYNAIIETAEVSCCNFVRI